jgi:hypothetical protein
MLKMKKLYRLRRGNLFAVMVVIGSIFLLSCSQEPQPSDSEIEKALITQLPAFINISKISVEAKQNLGTKVEPEWQARIRATITVASDTFELENEDSDENSEVTFVRTVKRSGESIEVFGKSFSSLYAGTWRTTVELEGQPLETLGQPLSAFGSKKVIARGSQEEKQYLADIQNAEMRVVQQKKQMLADAPKLIIGSWRGGNQLSTYESDGTKRGLHDDGQKTTGKWSIEGDVLTLVTNEINGKPFTDDQKDSRFRIVSITSSQLTVINSSGETWTGDRVQ